jgi:hypothetical protein
MASLSIKDKAERNGCSRRRKITENDHERHGSKKQDWGIAPAIIAVVTKVFGVVIDLFKKLKLKRKDGTVVEDTTTTETETYTDTVTESNNSNTKTTKSINETNSNMAEETAPKVETDEKSGVTTETTTDANGKEVVVYKDKDGKEIGNSKPFIKNKTMIIIVSVILVIGIVAIIIWRIRKKRKDMQGLGEAGLSRKQENFIRRQGLNNRAYASLVREEISRDRQPYNQQTRKQYYKKVFQDAFSRPISHKQASAALSHNNVLKEVRELAKAKGGGSKGWKEAWREVKKKGR